MRGADVKITVDRIHKEPEYTVGKISIDGEPAGFTLEDAVREVPGQAVETWKIAGETAIPTGTYQVIMNWSQRFGKVMPLLVDVPGFSGIRIHPGNTDADTEGCLLVGQHWGGGDWIDGSRLAFGPIYGRIEAAVNRGEPVMIEVM
jgi:hypothetical protein